MTDTQAMSIRLPNDLYERLRRAAFERRMPMNSLIVEGVEMRLAMTEAGKALNPLLGDPSPKESEQR